MLNSICNIKKHFITNLFYFEFFQIWFVKKNKFQTYLPSRQPNLNHAPPHPNPPHIPPNHHPRRQTIIPRRPNAHHPINRNCLIQRYPTSNTPISSSDLLHSKNKTPIPKRLQNQHPNPDYLLCILTLLHKELHPIFKPTIPNYTNTIPHHLPSQPHPNHQKAK